MFDNFTDHTSRINLRPNDFDWSHFLNNSIYPQLFEYARWEWAEANGIDITTSNLAAIVVRMEIDYVKPILWAPTAQIFVETHLDKRAQYSIELVQIVRSLEGETKAIGRLKLTLYDFLLHRIVPMSELQLRRDAK